LGHILAPRIAALGKDYLLHLFEKRFGKIANNGGDSVCNVNGSVDNGGIVSSDIHVEINANVAPYVKTWLEEIVNEGEYDREELLASEEKRAEALLQTGWVENILFRTPRQINAVADDDDDDDGESQARIGTQTPFYMPEILYLDIQAIRSIRMTTKMSVVGAALVLHVSALAGVPDATVRLKADPLEGRLEESRRALVRP